MAEHSIKYRGKNGEYHMGIPAHTLSEEEYSDLDADQRKLVRESPLYDYDAYREATTPKRAEPKAAPKRTEPKPEPAPAPEPEPPPPDGPTV